MTVIDLTPRIDPNESWTVTYYGKTTHVALTIGSVRTLATAAILFVDPFGNERVLTEAECKAIEEAFSTARLAAMHRREKLTGYSKPKVSRGVSGEVVVSLRGVVHGTRLSRLRRMRPCQWCDCPAMAVYVTSPRIKWNREANIEICQACVERIEKEQSRPMTEVTRLGT